MHLSLSKFDYLSLFNKKDLIRKGTIYKKGDGGDREGTISKKGDRFFLFFFFAFETLGNKTKNFPNFF